MDHARKFGMDNSARLFLYLKHNYKLCIYTKQTVEEQYQLSTTGPIRH